MVEPLTVLQSFPSPRPSSVNPYTLLLGERLAAIPGVTVLYFSWKTALLGRYDVFHVHWPEILVDGHSPLKKLVRQAFTLALLARLRLTRTPIVRTAHNVGLPEGISRREKWILGLFEKQTTLRIRLNLATELPPKTPFATIPQGHYRGWFESFERSDAVDGQFGYVGRVRRYKGAETLIEAFAALPGDGLSLRLGGYPSSPELSETIVSLAGDDPRITTELRFISDTELVDIVSSSELMVLPYRFMHNSAAAITVLSLDRPVLMPDNEVNRQLADEVGPGWVYSFEGTLDSEALTAALQAVRSDSREARPRLDERDWDAMAAAHVAAYREAIAVLRGPGQTRR